MATTIKKPKEIATIDCCMVVITPEKEGAEGIGITSNTEAAVEVQTETTEPVKLIIKGNLKAQKRGKTVVTGNNITLTDNMTILDAVQAIQGGTITKDATGKVTKYVPPAVGVESVQDSLTVDLYSAVQGDGDAIEYEKTTYKNCKGDPVAFDSKDDNFRTPTYVLKSIPKTGEPPYSIEYVDSLPTLTEPTVTKSVK